MIKHPSLLLVPLLILAMGKHVAHAQPSYPTVFFSYSALYDNTVCPPESDPFKFEYAKEAFQRQADFASMWAIRGPELMEALLKKFGKGFSRKEISATLSVCHNSWSYSNPLVLRVINFLKVHSATPWLDHAFVNLVFHELLHTWLTENFPGSTPLLEKYKDEPKPVQNHLHLIAIQKQIYLNLGRKDLSSWIAFLYPGMRGPERRAWEILQKEGHEAFIAELQSLTGD